MAALEITIIKDNAQCKLVTLTGALDKINSIAHGEELLALTRDGKELILDFAQLSQITSAGLRVLLKMQMQMEPHGTMRIVNISDVVMDVLRVTGFTGILTIEESPR